MTWLKEIWNVASVFDRAIMFLSIIVAAVFLYLGWYVSMLLPVGAFAWAVICTDGIRAFGSELERTD